MIVVGIIISVIGLLLVVSFVISRSRCRTRIEATVTGLDEKSMKLRGRTVRDITPVFTYTVDGKDYTYKAEMSTTNRRRFSVGQKETVFINEKHPSEARFGSNVGFLLFGLVLTFVGAAVIILSFM